MGYLYGFNNFYQKATKTKGNKRIILLGGSSLAWGVSAKKLSQELNVLALNAGIHALVGFRHFIRTVDDVIDKDKDIIVISPEYGLSSQDPMFDRFLIFCEIAISIQNKYPVECIGYTPSKIARIFPIINKREGHFFAAGFNEFGDYVYREQGINMEGKFKRSEHIVCEGISIEKLKKQYLQYMLKLKNKGYNIVYIPNFVPQNGCIDPKLIEKFHEVIFTNFGIEGFVNAKLMHEDYYFYNSEYHLTKKGVSKKTKMFSTQLTKYLSEQSK